MSARNWILALVCLALGVGLAQLLPRSGSMTMDPASGGDGACPDGSDPQYWVAPMDASYRRDGPGKSPMGMDLVPFCGQQGAADVDVRIGPNIVQNLGVVTARAELAPLARSVRAVGQVGYDESSYRMIHSRAEGWIEQIAVDTTGAAVEAGQALYTLFAPKLVSAESEYLNALAGGNAPLRRAARERLLALGYDGPQIRELEQRREPTQRLTPRADRAGVVAMLGVREGQFVSPGSHLMTLASLDEVWVLVDVLERDAGLIRAGQSATARLDAYPGRNWEGVVDYVYPELNPRTRTLKVRLRFPNPQRQLQPNMYADVSIMAPITEEALQVPNSALIRDAHGDRVVLALGDGAFRIAPVTVGHRLAGRSEILDGLEAGDEVVINGQFLIDSESNVDAEALRLRAERRHPRGTAMARIEALDADGIVLEHGPIEPQGEAGLSMPGMRMRFELDPQLDTQALEPGQSVHALIEQRGPGRYVVTELHPMEMSE